MNDVDLGNHAFTEGSESWSHELEPDFEGLLRDECRDEDLHLEEEHVAAGDGLGNLKEILLSTTVVVINEEAARVPVIFRIVEHFELHEGGLAGLHARHVSILWHVLLLGNVLHVRQIPH